MSRTRRGGSDSRGRGRPRRPGLGAPMAAVVLPLPVTARRSASRARSEPSHIPSLDGLRAASFFIVFAAHAGLDAVVPGAFGVTVFFFLSGYLITTLMRVEAAETGRVSLANFYLRRALRILPPFYIVLLAATALAAAGLVGGDLQPMAVASQVLHFSNYWIAAHGWSGSRDGHGRLLVPRRGGALLPALPDRLPGVESAAPHGTAEGVRLLGDVRHRPRVAMRPGLRPSRRRRTHLAVLGHARRLDCVRVRARRLEQPRARRARRSRRVSALGARLASRRGRAPSRHVRRSRACSFARPFATRFRASADADLHHGDAPSPLARLPPPQLAADALRRDGLVHALPRAPRGARGRRRALATGRRRGRPRRRCSSPSRSPGRCTWSSRSHLPGSAAGSEG